MRYAASLFGFVIGVAFAGAAQAQGPCFYPQINFQGQPMCLAPTQRVSRLEGVSKNLASVQIPRAVRVTVCERSHFREPCVTLDQSVANFATIGRVRWMSSFSSEPAGTRVGEQPLPRPGQYPNQYPNQNPIQYPGGTLQSSAYPPVGPPGSSSYGTQQPAYQGSTPSGQQQPSYPSSSSEPYAAQPSYPGAPPSGTAETTQQSSAYPPAGPPGSLPSGTQQSAYQGPAPSGQQQPSYPSSSSGPFAAQLPSYPGAPPSGTSDTTQQPSAYPPAGPSGPSPSSNPNDPQQQAAAYPPGRSSLPYGTQQRGQQPQSGIPSVESQPGLRRRMVALRRACGAGDVRACVRFGVIIGENREGRVQWRRENPELFWWDR